MEEWKIGEIRQVNGEWYQCVEQPEHFDEVKGVCILCSFGNSKGNCELDKCSGTYRSDKKSIIFRKLKKIGEPYMLEDKKFQKYRVFHTPYIYNKIDYSWQSFADPYYISLEIKQNKEDMEENKLNLKPFDIQKAKAGKPVCTRDGRKARIVCFDKNDSKSIVALIQPQKGSDIEVVMDYHNDGKVYERDESTNDLMMLPEKKEGWVNICRNLNTNKTELDTKDIYNTKEEALQNLSSMTYVTTVKIEWEE